MSADEDGGPKTRLRCPACGYTHWNNPTPVLAAVIELADRDGQPELLALAAPDKDLDAHQHGQHVRHGHGHGGHAEQGAVTVSRGGRVTVSREELDGLKS
jgi:hypothetical protein